MPKLSFKQKCYSKACKILAGDKHEERATNLLPKEDQITGIRLCLYNYVSNLRYEEGERLYKKYKTHTGYY